MVLADSHRISRVLWYSGAPKIVSAFVYGAITLSDGLFQNLPLASTLYVGVLQPPDESGFGLFPFRSPLLRESRLFSLPLAT